MIPDCKHRSALVGQAPVSDDVSTASVKGKRHSLNGSQPPGAIVQSILL